ncbi:PREDICTED: uncharacterized protein LOC106339047 [Brassica oleracea var. oleracea]|uniref:uncharacterized protein LOC106339047 n=1 Tax=Brassica oleracea var. oleracea TaxID=109376 RepID=UPI0006A6C3E3|nr:PREDICTED: uncharacterized protein LOC106339047 [Brassica oleracea var. oleracea]
MSLFLSDKYSKLVSFFEKATSPLNEAKESVTSIAESVGASLTDSARNAVENALSRGIEGAKFLLHVFEEKRTEVSSKHVGAVTNASDGASSSSTVASRDLLVSTDQSGHSI